MAVHKDETGIQDEPDSGDRRKDHALREMVDNLLDEVRTLNGRLEALDRDDLDNTRLRFLKHAEVIWEHLLDGKEGE